MESKHLAILFAHDTEHELCNVVKLSLADGGVANGYTGDNTIEDFLSFLESEEVECIVEWERPRNFPKGRL